MRDVVVDETIYIDEESYQKLKKDICKSDDYFNANYLTTFLTTFYKDKKNKKN